MKKNMFLFFQNKILFIIFIFYTGSVYSFEYNGLKYLAFAYEDEAYVDGYFGNPSQISIPSVVVDKQGESYYNEETQKYEYKEKRYRVTAIGSDAFESCTSLTSITIPNSITYIGDNAFAYCSNLSSITIPNSVRTIGNYAFSGCKKLESISIPNSVNTIKGGLFWGCTNLRLISIPNSVKIIEYDAFDGCTSLTSISIPNSVESIQYMAFMDCTSLRSISIPNSVKIIEENAFEGCTNLEYIYLPNSIKSIKGSAFKECISLTSVIIPNSVKSIEEWTFSGCTNLTSITIPESVTSIKGFAFQDCSSLTSIHIPNSVTSIGQYAFYNCTSLSSIFIPSSVTSIGRAAFSSCNNIKRIYCQATTPPEVYNDIYPFYTYPPTIKIYVPKEAVEDYKSHDVWKNYKINPLMNLSIKEGYKFSDYSDMNFVPKGVTADGLSKLEVTQKEEQPSNVPDLQSIKVKFEIDGKECDDAKIIGTYGKVEWIEKDKDINKWGFTYTAPEDYPETIGGNEYKLDVSLEANINGSMITVGAAQIIVMRPGVMLVHGLNSDASCFAKVENYLTSIGEYNKYQIKNVNYYASNKSKFHVNTHRKKIIENNAKILFKQLADNGIVSSSYDMIGHSMGGILIRKYAQEVDEKSVNKIITINTPHSGSPWADAYIKMVSRVDETMANREGVTGAFWFGVRLFAQYQEIFGNWGAIQDLSTSSEAIKDLNDPNALAKVKNIPVQSLYSTINMEGVDPQKVISIDPRYTWLYDTFTVGTFLEKDKEGKINDVVLLNRLFGKEKHDGVVSLDSQRGGLTGIDLSPKGDEYKGAFGLSSYSHHCNITDNPETFSEIRKLLYSPKNSSNFVKGFNPIDLSNKNARTRASEETVTFKEPSESQFIKIQAEKEDTLRVLKVIVSGSNDLWTNLILIDLGDDKMLTGIGQNEYRFRIPDTYEGDLTVYALGRAEDDALVGDSVVVNYEKGASLSYMFFEDWPEITMVEGQQIELNVIGGWSNGEENYIIPDYSTNKEGIIESDGSLITAKAEGECLLIAKYEGLADTITVKVVAANANSILTIERNKPSIRYSDGNLKVIPINGYSGPVKVMIYDMSGNVCYQQHRSVSVQANEPIEFDLSSLSTQLYIARVRTSNEHAIKFVKK